MNGSKSLDIYECNKNYHHTFPFDAIRSGETLLFKYHSRFSLRFFSIENVFC
jgi:hypothetical protein